MDPRLVAPNEQLPEHVLARHHRARLEQTPRFDPPLTGCVVCGSSSILRFDRDHEGRTIDRCRRCGVLFLNPQYADDWLMRLYGEYIPENTEEGSAAERMHRAPVHAYHLAMIERAVRPGRLLSVGCGNGVELEVARSRGWQIEGFDVDADTVARVAARLGVPIRSGRFLEVDWPDSIYDCVYLHHVLEHPKDPAAYLRRIRRLLRPGGVLFIACPNIRSISNRWKTFAGKAGVKPRRGRHYDSWHHLFHFSPRTLSGLLVDRFGFEVLRVANGVKAGDRRGLLSLPARLAVNDVLPPWSSIFLVLARRPAD